MIVRLIAACALSVACALAGRSVAGACVRRAKTLGALLEDIRKLEGSMLDKLLPLREALGAGGTAFRAVSAEMHGCGAAEAWRRAAPGLTGRGGSLDCLTAEDMAAISALFDGLGASYAAQQRMLIRDALETLTMLRQEADKKAREESKLYSTLGLLTGLALAILFM